MAPAENAQIKLPDVNITSACISVLFLSLPETVQYFYLSGYSYLDLM